MIDIIGLVAAFLTTISFLPQVIKTVKTRDTSGISLLMYLVFVLGVTLWLAYGILLKNKIIILANLITLVLAGVILAIKVKNCWKR